MFGFNDSVSLDDGFHVARRVRADEADRRRREEDPQRS